jgi:hypothetical protein
MGQSPHFVLQCIAAGALIDLIGQSTLLCVLRLGKAEVWLLGTRAITPRPVLHFTR